MKPRFPIPILFNPTVTLYNISHASVIQGERVCACVIERVCVRGERECVKEREGKCV